MPGENYYVYILTNWNHRVMYIGVTNSLQRRLEEHRAGALDGFTKTYNVNRLVYCEHFRDPKAAIMREKQLKRWTRAKKNALVSSRNPNWEEIIPDW